MKKLMAILICIILICSNVVFAEENQIITDKLSEIWLSPKDDVQILENIRKSNEAKIEESINLYLIAPGYAREKIGISSDDEEMKKQVNDMYDVNEEEILKVYRVKNNIYAKQYVDNLSLSYLISDDYNWFMRGNDHYIRYNADGSMYDYNDSNTTAFGADVIDDEGLSFLKDKVGVLKILKDANITNVSDVKILSLHQKCTCLYIDSSLGKFMICIYKGTTHEKNDNGFYVIRNWVDNLELYKVYNSKDFLQIISDEANVMNSTKQTFETEALSLQENGLLYGNENGLDLLKPLTRIEAATMLLRALGETTTNETAAQTFSDVPANHWGYGAAENAYSLGLIKGIGDDMFVPDDIVTGPQFATMVLRAGNHTDFNWEDALDILINEGVISAEDASTMDFFTRGDMAKIIYESIEKGLF